MSLTLLKLYFKCSGCSQGLHQKSGGGKKPSEEMYVQHCPPEVPHQAGTRQYVQVTKSHDI